MGAWRAVLVVVLVAGCGSEGLRERPPEWKPKPFLDAGDVAEELTRAMCAYAMRCQVAPTTGFDRCVEDFVSWKGYGTTFGTPQGLEDAVLAHRVKFDPFRARRCINAIPDLECGARTDPMGLPDCVAAFVGTLEDGDHCITDAACASGFCLPFSYGGACEGRCVERGVACREDGDCNAGDVCEGHTCVPDDVPPGALGEPCGTHDSCESGLACVSVGGTAVCRPMPREGEKCGAGDACGEGLLCRHDVTGLAATGTCYRPPPPAEGVSCDLATPWTCGPDLVCVPGDRGHATCRRPRVRDEECRSTYDCGGVYSPWMCDLAQGRCVERPRTGPCVDGRADGCDLDHAFCDRDAPGGPTCRPFRATGEPCASASECGPQFGGPACIPSKRGGTVCAPKVRELCTP